MLRRICACAMLVAGLTMTGNAMAGDVRTYDASQDEVTPDASIQLVSHADACGCDTSGCGRDDGSCGSRRCCNSCNLGDPWTLQRRENRHGITFGGWFEFGYNSNNVPLSIADGDLLSFGDNPGRLNLNQNWYYIEKKAEGQGGCWDWGFRCDVLYGTDAQKAQAFGQPSGWDTSWDHGIYGWAMPQAYVSVDNGPLSVKAGHCYTPMGYEVMTAPDNFFFTHSLTMFNSEPFTHTGVLASYEVNDDVTVHGGWTAGWDTGFDSFNGGSNFLGGIGLPVAADVTFTYTLTAGNMGLRGEGYSHSLVFDWEISDKWEYVFQSDLVSLEADAVNAGVFNNQVGVNQYLFYTINDRLKLGSRIEWWQTDSNENRYEWTCGVNIRPHANLVFRPEVRYDWGNAVLVPNQHGGEITTFNIDAIVTF